MDAETIQKGLDVVIPFVTQYGMQVLGAIIILVLGKLASRLGSRLTRKALERGKVDAAVVGFTSSMVGIAIMAFAVLAALAKLGVQTTSFVAVLGAAGLAVGLALQGSLSNFAAGVMLLIFRPIRWATVVDRRHLGSIDEISIFVTVMNTLDNQKVIVPNAHHGQCDQQLNGNGTRRVDMVAGISYGDDMGKAKGSSKASSRRTPRC